MSNENGNPTQGVPPGRPPTPQEQQVMVIHQAAAGQAQLLGPVASLEYACAMLALLGSQTAGVKSGASLNDRAQVDQFNKLFTAAQAGVDAVKKAMDSPILVVRPGTQLPPLRRKD